MPLLEQREKVSKVGILLITGDRGLAGAFNTNIIREGTRLQREWEFGRSQAAVRTQAAPANRRSGQSAVGSRQRNFMTLSAYCPLPTAR